MRETEFFDSRSSVGRVLFQKPSSAKIANLSRLLNLNGGQLIV